MDLATFMLATGVIGGADDTLRHLTYNLESRDVPMDVNDYDAKRLTEDLTRLRERCTRTIELVETTRRETAIRSGDVTALRGSSS